MKHPMVKKVIKNEARHILKRACTCQHHHSIPEIDLNHPCEMSQPTAFINTRGGRASKYMFHEDLLVI
ncbi:predicted protein [Botrytis cinerea T4]|uniref:Uncharacterized protein n=1 Tax=Botryotinia fuckeliana (strain T4) TaxID=999810 RepID=G2XSJ7_BOTF4|nr:predicted protein [Botrytis cinerea T4]